MLAPGGNSDVEARIRAGWEARDFRATATLAIESFGPEILGFLGAVLNDSQQADDAFSMFCEDVWRGLAGLRWRGSARGWCFTLARHAALRLARTQGRWGARRVPLSHVTALAAHAHTDTAAWERTGSKSQMRKLREQLPQDEQVLLILRVDKQLPWADVALVLANDGEALAGVTLTRRCAVVRKRFQLVKEKLRVMAQAEGLC